MPDIVDSSGDATLEVGQQMSTAEHQGFEAILAQLSENDPSLTDLDLTRNAIGDAEAASLAGALRWNTALTRLDLTDNDIGCYGAKDLGKALRQNTTLTELRLCENPLADCGCGVNVIADALFWNTTLATLDLVSDPQRCPSTDACQRLCSLLSPEQRAHRQKQLHRRLQLVFIAAARNWTYFWTYGFLIASPHVIASMVSLLASMALHRMGFSVVGPVAPVGMYLTHEHGVALCKALACASLVGSFACFCKLPGRIKVERNETAQDERNDTTPDEAAMQHLLEQHDRIAAAGRRLGLCLYPVGVLYRLTNGELVNAAFPAAWFCLVAVIPATQQCYLSIVRVAHYILLPSRAILGAMGIVPAQYMWRFWSHPVEDVAAVSLASYALLHRWAFPLAVALLNTSVTAHLTDVLWVNAVVMFFADTTYECTMSLVMSVLSCGFFVLKLALLPKRDEHDRGDESLGRQEASLAKLSKIEGLARELAQHATRLGHRGGESRPEV